MDGAPSIGKKHPPLKIQRLRATSKKCLHLFDTRRRNLRRNTHRHNPVEADADVVAGPETAGAVCVNQDLLVRLAAADQQMVTADLPDDGVHSCHGNIRLPSVKTLTAQSMPAARRRCPRQVKQTLNGQTKKYLLYCTQPEQRRTIIMKKRIAVLFGGCSDEYAVSLKSAQAVIGAIDQEQY